MRPDATRRASAIVVVLVTIATLAAIVGCNTTFEVSDPCKGDVHCTVVVNPFAVTLPRGDTMTFIAGMSPEPDTSARFSWMSSDSTKVRVDSTGLATTIAQSPLVAICATLTRDTKKRSCAQVTVL
jgi:uncharacterized protein YjdB